MRTKSLFSPYLKFELLAGSPFRAVKVPDVTGDSTRRGSPNFLVSGWLAGFQTLSLQGMTAKGCGAKKLGSFAEQSSSLCDPPHPPGDKLWALPLVQAGSQKPKLSSPTLLDGTPLPPRWLFKHRKGLLAIAGRQAKKFCPKSVTGLKNPDIYKKLAMFTQDNLKAHRAE